MGCSRNTMAIDHGRLGLWSDHRLHGNNSTSQCIPSLLFGDDSRLRYGPSLQSALLQNVRVDTPLVIMSAIESSVKARISFLTPHTMRI